MSDSPIKTPKQLIAIIIAAFLIPIAIIVLLTKYVSYLQNSTDNSNAYTEDAIAERIKPIGTFSTEAPIVVATTSGNEGSVVKTSLASGEEVYNTRCSSCHAAGILNAPKIGDNASWLPRLSQGLEKLLYSALNGKGSMGAQKGSQHSDEEIKRAVIYLTNKSGGNFK